MKKYIDVITKMRADGSLVPLSILWEDGREFIIDKVLDVRPCASLKGGGAGVRYQVRINRQVKNLFLDEYRWFLEVD